MMNKNITNLAFFRQNSFGDDSLYRELLEIFIKTTPEMVGQLKMAASQNDTDQLGKIAHKLKSNVQSVGLDNIYLLLDDIEMRKYDNINSENFQLILDTIMENCNIAVSEVEKEINLL